MQQRPTNGEITHLARQLQLWCGDGREKWEGEMGGERRRKEMEGERENLQLHEGGGDGSVMDVREGWLVPFANKHYPLSHSELALTGEEESFTCTLRTVSEVYCKHIYLFIDRKLNFPAL